jgi:hypothetical protein
VVERGTIGFEGERRESRRIVAVRSRVWKKKYANSDRTPDVSGASTGIWGRTQRGGRTGGEGVDHARAESFKCTR